MRPVHLIRTREADAGAECIDDVVARLYARLRPVCGALPPEALEALVQELVLDVTRFVLRWEEEAAEEAARRRTTRAAS